MLGRARDGLGTQPASSGEPVNHLRASVCVAQARRAARARRSDVPSSAALAGSAVLATAARYSRRKLPRDSTVRVPLGTPGPRRRGPAPPPGPANTSQPADAQAAPQQGEQVIPPERGERSQYAGFLGGERPAPGRAPLLVTRRIKVGMATVAGQKSGWDLLGWSPDHRAGRRRPVPR